MKRIVIAFALSASVFASLAQSSGNITISGTVANNTRITVTPQSGYNNLNLADGETDKVVAVVNERSNKRDGYTVTLTSENATGSQAFLKGTAGNEDTVLYSISYDGTPVTLSSGSAVVTDANGRTPGSGVNKNLAVTIAPQWVNTDTYSDTLTLTIAAK